MKNTTRSGKSLDKNLKSTKKKTVQKSNQIDLYPRCSRCGSRTVNLEHLEQELLVTLSLHCLICGHHTFLGRPVIRLLRRPKVTIPDSIKRYPGM